MTPPASPPAREVAERIASAVNASERTQSDHHNRSWIAPGLVVWQFRWPSRPTVQIVRAPVPGACPDWIVTIEWSSEAVSARLHVNFGVARDDPGLVRRVDAALDGMITYGARNANDADLLRWLTATPPAADAGEEELT